MPSVALPQPSISNCLWLYQHSVWWDGQSKAWSRAGEVSPPPTPTSLTCTSVSLLQAWTLLVCYVHTRWQQWISTAPLKSPYYIPHFPPNAPNTCNIKIPLCLRFSLSLELMDCGVHCSVPCVITMVTGRLSFIQVITTCWHLALRAELAGLSVGSPGSALRADGAGDLLLTAALSPQQDIWQNTSPRPDTTPDQQDPTQHLTTRTRHNTWPPGPDTTPDHQDPTQHLTTRTRHNTWPTGPTMPRPPSTLACCATPTLHPGPLCHTHPPLWPAVPHPPWPAVPRPPSTLAHYATPTLHHGPLCHAYPPPWPTMPRLPSTLAHYATPTLHPGPLCHAHPGPLCHAHPPPWTTVPRPPSTLAHYATPTLHPGPLCHTHPPLWPAVPHPPWPAVPRPPSTLARYATPTLHPGPLYHAHPPPGPDLPQYYEEVAQMIDNSKWHLSNYNPDITFHLN